MVQQFTSADSKFNGKRRKTRKETFLARMDALLPWARMLSVIEPVYPKADNGMYRSSYHLTPASNRCLVYATLLRTSFGINFRPFLNML